MPQSTGLNVVIRLSLDLRKRSKNEINKSK